MTINPARLGARQVDVLRAAAKPYGLIRFADGGWQADGKACTQPARSVTAIEPALLVEGKAGAIVTGGSWKSRPGTWMVLSDAGQAVLDAYDATRPEDLVARQQRTDAIKALAGLSGDELAAGIRDVAAAELGVDSGAFRVLSRALHGEQPDLPG